MTDDHGNCSPLASNDIAGLFRFMLKIENVHKNIGEFSLGNINLDIAEGEYLTIVGPTGSGKTILLETIAGIHRPDSGRIFLDGQDITNLPPRKRGIGMVYQDYMLFPHLSVIDNIIFGLKSHKIGRKEALARAEKMAEMLAISSLMHRRPGTLSGGEKQRTAIARALVMEPRLLLLDEPLSALDAQTRNRLQQELHRIHTLMETTIIHVTHNLDEAFHLASQLAIMNLGEIVQTGEPTSVFRKPRSKFAADFTEVTNLFRGNVIIENGVPGIDIGGLHLISATPASGQVHTAIRPEDILISLLPIETSAENCFAGCIKAITNEGPIMKITVDAGQQFIVALTRRSFDDLRLTYGMTVYLTVKATAVHVLPTEKSILTGDPQNVHHAFPVV